MAGTTYNTLAVAEEHPERKSSGALRRVAFGTSLVVCVCAMFFAGRVYQSQTLPFTHEEVMNAESYCAEGEYIGQCVECKDCGTYEYANGGCTYFKDTFCTYCTPILNCQRENIECTNRLDQICTECDCDDPAKFWDDQTKERFAIRGGDPDKTYSCYLGQECRPCDVCAEGYYQDSACDPARNMDTVCKKCTECEVGMYVKEQCEYSTDTVCEKCGECGFEETVATHCTGHEEGLGNDSLKNGHDIICRGCLECESIAFVDNECTPWSDTDCTDCLKCVDGEYITKDCEFTDSPTLGGRDQTCADCSPLLDPLESGAFITAVCLPLDHTDFQYADCTQCVYGEYIEQECVFGSKYVLGSDRVCDECTPLPDCPKEMVECTNDGNSVCTRCQHSGYEGGLGEDYFDSWGTCCAGGHLGRECGWKRIEDGCDEKSQSFMERSAKRGGFKGETAAEFVDWCRVMCGEVPSCTGIEVLDCLANGTCDPKPASLCALKDHVDIEFGTGDASLTCYQKP